MSGGGGAFDLEEDASKLKFGKAGSYFFHNSNSEESRFEDSPYLTNDELYVILLQDKNTSHQNE